MPWSQFAIQLIFTSVSLVLSFTALYITFTQTKLLERQINLSSTLEQPNFIVALEPNGPIENNRYAHIDLSLYAELGFVKNRYLHITRYDAIELELNKVGVGSENYLLPFSHYFASCGRSLKLNDGQVYKCHGLNNSKTFGILYEKFFQKFGEQDGKIYSNSLRHYLKIAYQDLESVDHITFVGVSPSGELDFEQAKNGFEILDNVRQQSWYATINDTPDQIIEKLRKGYDTKFIEEFFATENHN